MYLTLVLSGPWDDLGSRLLLPSFLKIALIRAFEWPWVILTQPATLLFIIPSVLSTLLFGAVIAGAVLMRAFRSALQPFAFAVIDRVGTARKGILTGVALALFVLAAFLALLALLAKPLTV